MSEIKFASIVYLPPTRLYPTEAFMQNMRNFPTKHPLYFFTDEYENKGTEEIIKLNGKVEVAKDEKNKLAVNNLIFFTAMRIAASKGLTYVLLLENDCRVGKKHWDDIIFQEMLSKNCEAVAAGTIMIFNPSCYNRAAAMAFERFLSKTLPTRPCPLSITGSSNLAEKRDTALFPNGAFAIYRLDWLLKSYPDIIGQGTTINLARKTRTWDYAIADKLWEQFHEGVYDKVVHIDSIYSGYGNIMSTEEERKQWLIDGKIVGVHQIKSDWAGPEPKPERDLIDIVPETTKSVPAINPNNEFRYPGVTEMFMCTYAKDFPWLVYFLKSMRKFATGFSQLTILVPNEHYNELKTLIAPFNKSGFPIRPKSGYQWKDKGFLWHEAQICRADEWCKSADLICHADPDIIFTAPVTPETFFESGKPLLRYEPFSTLTIRHPGTLYWKIAVENCLPFPVANEHMRGHCHCYLRNVYAKTRQLVEQKTGLKFNEYVQTCKNGFPQSFAEHPTLGAVAYECFKDEYLLRDLSKETNPDRCPYPIIQFWSHGQINQPQEIWIDGIKRNVTPEKVMEEILK